MWRSDLDSIVSKGSVLRPGSLGGLAEARSKHDSQFFTSSVVAELMWRWVSPALTQASWHLSLLDNSVGSGRLFGLADPDKHSLWGVDVDAHCIKRLREASLKAGFRSEFRCSSLVDCSISNMDIAFINPAFSIVVDSPSMVPLPSCTWGTYGKGKRANLTHYSLEQALLASSLVVALLPSSAVDEVKRKNLSDPLYNNRLAAIVGLPDDSFQDEGITVSTSLCIFDSVKRKIPVLELTSNSEVENLGLTLNRSRGVPSIKQYGVTQSEPLITTPVTGDNSVRIAHDSRWVKLKFSCGLTEALTKNKVLVGLIPSEEKVRAAKHVKYIGQGILDVESWLASGSAKSGLYKLCELIKEAGGNPVVDAGLSNYVAKRDRQSKIDLTPYRKWVYQPSGAGALDSFVAVCHTEYFTIEDDWTFEGDVVDAGTEIKFVREADLFNFSFRGQNYSITEDSLKKHFELKDKKSDHGEWVCLFEGRVHAFPDRAHEIKKRAEKAGVLDWLSWDYQSHDFVELVMSSKGDVCAWQMALGKTRIALSLAFLGGKHNLIIVEPYLIDEMMIELDALNVDDNLYQVVTNVEDTINLKKINFITYNRLRMKIGGHHKLTYASKLRRRIHTLVADEGSLLSNPNSQQTRAVWQVSAKKRFALDGTPIMNYPRNIQPVLNYTAGDSTVKNPYGLHHYYMGEHNINSVRRVGRGIDRFKDEFVTLEWCTNQFSDGLTEGAKREVPKIGNLAAYRRLLNSNIKRRVQEEPEVQKFINIKPPVRTKTILDWDDSHLSHYLKVSDEFAQYFKKAKESAYKTGKNLNLIALLARINAVKMACNQPQKDNKFATWYGITSKQQYIVDQAIRNTENGDKTIVYVENPETVKLITSLLVDQGYDAVPFHGGIPIKKRTKDMNARFRFGDAPILISTIQVSAKGLNLYCANKVIIGSRSWKSSIEEQCIYRVCRPQQKRDVFVEYVMLEGSIDIYQDQMVDFKKNAASAGLDYAQPEFEDKEFLHLDTLLGQFVEDLVKFKGLTARRDLRGNPTESLRYAL